MSDKLILNPKSASWAISKKDNIQNAISEVLEFVDNCQFDDTNTNLVIVQVKEGKTEISIGDIDTVYDAITAKYPKVRVIFGVKHEPKNTDFVIQLYIIEFKDVGAKTEVAIYDFIDTI